MQGIQTDTMSRIERLRDMLSARYPGESIHAYAGRRALSGHGRTRHEALQQQKERSESEAELLQTSHCGTTEVESLLVDEQH